MRGRLADRLGKKDCRKEKDSKKKKNKVGGKVVDLVESREILPPRAAMIGRQKVLLSTFRTRLVR